MQKRPLVPIDRLPRVSYVTPPAGNPQRTKLDAEWLTREFCTDSTSLRSLFEN